MSQPSSPEPYKSALPELNLPPGGFVSTIPPHLLEDADPQMVWLLNEISKNTQATEFACRAAVDGNRHLRTLNGKTFKNEKAAEELRADVETLKVQATTFSPFYKPLVMFASLWEYRWFKWIFLLGLFVIFGLAYPYYVDHQFDTIKAVVKKMIGAD